MTSSAGITRFLVLSEADADQKREVELEGLVVVVLEENTASTGYEWKHEEPDRDKLTPLNSGIVPGGKDPGAPGAQVFLLAAVQAGTTTLQYGLYPPAKPEPERRVTFSIEIVPPN